MMVCIKAYKRRCALLCSLKEGLSDQRVKNGGASSRMTDPGLIDRRIDYFLH